MAVEDRAFHYVCRLQEARQLIEDNRRFWVVECGCRKERGSKCRSERHDICLWFHGQMGESFGPAREISRHDAMNLVRLSEREHLVNRPFRGEKDRSVTEGICFCCDDCCYYFTKPGEKCDKGDFVEKTDLDNCGACGTCVEVCYFNARRLDDDKLLVDRDKCYGCALCVDVCPDECIDMAKAG